MRKRNIIAAILMIAMTTSLFTGCKPSIPDDGTATTEQGNTSVTTESTTAEVQKAPVTLYANFDNEVLNDAPTTLPDDGFYYKAFTSISTKKQDNGETVDFWASLFDPTFPLAWIRGTAKGVLADYSYITDTNAFVDDTKNDFQDKILNVEEDDYNDAKNKLNVEMWGEFKDAFLGEEDPAPLGYNGTYNYEKLDTEVMPQIAALAEAWMEANFMGTPIPEDMTTEDFRTYINTDEAYAYFASKGILPYQIDNNGSTKESYEKTGLTKEHTQELFVTDKVSIWTNYAYTNFNMPCFSRIYLKTEDGQEEAYTVKFRMVVKPEKNDDGSWSFKLDYATFEQHINAMDKWGTISDPKVCFTLMDEAWGGGIGY